MITPIVVIWVIKIFFVQFFCGRDLKFCFVFCSVLLDDSARAFETVVFFFRPKDSFMCNGKGPPLPLGSKGRGTEAPHPLKLSFLDAETRAERVCLLYKQALV